MLRGRESGIVVLYIFALAAPAAAMVHVWSMAGTDQFPPDQQIGGVPSDEDVSRERDGQGRHSIRIGCPPFVRQKFKMQVMDQDA
jgi:hypothetical protein